MAFKALKLCRFGRHYAIGETIPDDAIDPSMVRKLKMIGMIEELPGTATQDEQSGENTPDSPESVPASSVEPARRGRKPKEK